MGISLWTGQRQPFVRWRYVHCEFITVLSLSKRQMQTRYMTPRLNHQLNISRDLQGAVCKLSPIPTLFETFLSVATPLESLATMSQESVKHKFTVDALDTRGPTRDNGPQPEALPEVKKTEVHPNGSNNDENASIYFVGTATTILEWEGIRLMTDPNFLHAGDHVHLGPGVTGARQTNPAMDLNEVPRIDAVLLSHYHADHFDQQVEDSLRRDLPIVTTPHAKECLQVKKAESQKFTRVYDLDFFESTSINIKAASARSSSRSPSIKVTGMPGKHVPPGPLAAANDLLGAVPPTNGWMIELGYNSDEKFQSGYRIYISGDTLMVDELQEIPKRYAGHNIDLMLVHLGGELARYAGCQLIVLTRCCNQAPLSQDRNHLCSW